MKKKNRSEVSLPSVKSKSETQYKEEIYVPPLDRLTIKILSFQIPNEEPKPYALTVTFFDQLLITNILTSSGSREVAEELHNSIVKGYMNYDPSDYEKMSLFADCPLTVSSLLHNHLPLHYTSAEKMNHESISIFIISPKPYPTGISVKIHPFRSVETNLQVVLSASGHSSKSNTKSSSIAPSAYRPDADTHCCNIDILPVFIDKNKIYFEKRLEPVIKPSVLAAKSWDNLPLIKIVVKITRNPANSHHHGLFSEANVISFTLLGSFNMITPFDDECVYTAATRLPIENETHTALFPFNNGYRIPKRFDPMSFYPLWENLRLRDEYFTRGDDKFQSNFSELQNDENIDLNHYINELPKHYTTLWASFHRTLILKSTEQWLSKRIRQYKWPIEVHVYGEHKGYSFMGFMDLFQLLYPGVKTARLAVPLQWVDAETMMIKCGCELLLTPNEKVSSIMATVQKSSKATTESAQASTNTEVTYVPRPTGSDDSCSFVILEVSLARAFKEPVVPPIMSMSNINDMLIEMEVIPTKRECTGRGQLDRDWQATVRSAAASLRRVPYFGMTDLCTMNRQLSETRTRVEMVTSFWQDSAIYVNNNFVVKDFLGSDETFEEMLMMAHACLVRISNDTLLGGENRQELNSTLRAARHARQLQDLSHAMDLYLQLVVEGPREADSWRELSTCLMDIDRDWANVCIDKSVWLNPRHPLSILSKGAMIFEENPDAAEPFFTALLAFYPFYIPLWTAANAYYIHREYFHMAGEIMEQIKKTKAEGLAEEMQFPRLWEYELGDWWENTPLLPGTNLYYDAADLLLRIRAISLAEVCVARAYLESGETALHYHMVALCCRMRGNIEDAMCHLKQGIEKFGDISYLRSLEGECYHKLKDISASTTSFGKAGSNYNPYSSLLTLPRRDHRRTRTILTDLTRRHPSAYAWMAFADDWMMQSTMGEGGDAETTEEQRTAAANAATCALNALKYDRRAAPAWALLSILLKPTARRQYCREMALLCGDNKLKLMEKRSKQSLETQHSLCFRIGKALRECNCKMCEHISL